MMRRLMAGVAVAVALACSPVAAQEIPAAKQALIQELVATTGIEKLMVQQIEMMLPPMMNSLRPLFPTVPPELWAALQTEMRDQFVAELPAFLGAAYKVYDKYYTEGDLAEVLRFYKTPVGQKMIANLPAITQETGTVGMLWGQEIGRRAAGTAVEKFRSLGYQPKQL